MRCYGLQFFCRWRGTEGRCGLHGIQTVDIFSTRAMEWSRGASMLVSRSVFHTSFCAALVQIDVTFLY